RSAGPLGVYSLGVFSGVASSCCAPVLAGVIALSGLASSFGAALGLGTAYVFGMVAPLFLISLLWDRYDWRSSRLFRPRSFTWGLGRFRRTITGTNLASGTLLAVMGLAAVWVGFAGAAMPSAGGWLAKVTATLQHYGRVVSDALSWMPNWAAVLLLLAIVALLARRAVRQVRRPREEPREEEGREVQAKEASLEHQDA
ncbi:MAG: cytochrome c biogenesis protein CcdA, partial [Candidatus Methylomirabilales bacterium]